MCCAAVAGLISTFLLVHPLGAKLDYIWAYLKHLDIVLRSSEIEALLERYPSVFQLELCGIGVEFEKRWRFVAHSTVSNSNTNSFMGAPSRDATNANCVLLPPSAFSMNNEAYNRSNVLDTLPPPSRSAVASAPLLKPNLPGDNLNVRLENKTAPVAADKQQPTVAASVSVPLASSDAVTSSPLQSTVESANDADDELSVVDGSNAK
jgi:hypothetical protein